MQERSHIIKYKYNMNMYTKIEDISFIDGCVNIISDKWFIVQQKKKSFPVSSISRQKHIYIYILFK